MDKRLVGLTRGGGRAIFLGANSRRISSAWIQVMLCLGMKENSESALSTNKVAISNATRNLIVRSILAQDVRWRPALHMQVGREVACPVADGCVTRKNLPLGGEQQLETVANTP